MAISKCTQSLTERLNANIDNSGGPDACWPWLGATNDNGYGYLSVNGQSRGAHRVAWEIANDQAFPDGFDGCHSCDNPPCCNPAHIWPGTHRENMQDASSKGRLSGPRASYPRSYSPRRGHPNTTSPRGEQHPAAKLTDALVRYIRAAAHNGIHPQALAKEIGVSLVTVTDVIHRKSWKHVR